MKEMVSPEYIGELCKELSKSLDIEKVEIEFEFADAPKAKSKPRPGHWVTKTLSDRVKVLQYEIV